jgi:hypothetical protein
LRNTLGSLGRSAVASLAAIVLASGCGLLGGPKTVSENVPDVMTVSSPVFTRDVMGQAYTCDGSGKSPAIHWSGAPPRTKALALVADDARAPITPYIYWIVFNIGPQTTGFQEGQIPPGARQASNSAGKLGYDPPCPASPGHRYRFTIYALSKMLRIPAGANEKTAWMSIAQSAIARGRLTAIASP